MLKTIFFSPVLMVIAAALVVLLAKIFRLPKPHLLRLVWLSLLFAITGAAASLIFTIICMIWYEHATGYGAGNGPVGWIFIYGPISASLGQLLALLVWWFKKPSDILPGFER